ncbi:hypothetical protein FJ959_18370 [Mesorhizobium sp. B2-2-4]|uniref:hypothetical protein n=1 Tax=unclassified Mesorhizobium TaxID=325217 RepID=UPI00112E5FA0|nr:MULTISPECIES: hypothetical protein [unclassified Mesorhizobium]TPM55370.1 hypothetical protein FJ959_18370 [Mesorhizobium sp. B2-2-4]TPM66337.1 hypothetical protein FJ965_14330 [Mesorhizobium sp. B2-2-1]TPN60580.1 hypothetical protein FJ984_30445 [Mesorhizobium sp. B1-1-3]
MSDRLTVRLAYQRGWQVVDGSTVLRTFETKEGAFQFLVDRGARVHLHWRRTKIGGQEPPYDFDAEFQSESVGRIKKELHGPSAGRWFWSCFVGGARGSTEIRDEAVFEVERAYTRIVVKADYPK